MSSPRPVLDLKATAEREMGGAMTESEFSAALSQAAYKLDRINQIGNTHHGFDYLAILVSEAVRASRLTAYFDAINYLRDDEMGKEKEPSAERRNGPSLANLPQFAP